MEQIYNEPKEAAKALKRELTKKFQGVKFSIRSSYMSLGSTSITVEYRPVNNWPSITEVKGIADHYCDSEGNTDMVLPNPKHVVSDDGKLLELGGVTYVHVTNHLSSDIKQQLR